MRDARPTLAVLAGGEGRRMGKAKALLEIDGSPVLEYLMDRLQWEGPKVLVTAPGRERPPGAGRFDLEAVDAVAGEGPLRGLLTALDHSPTDLIVVTTVDMPGIAKKHLLNLLNGFNERRDLDALMLQRATPEGIQFEPFPSVFRRSMRDRVAAKLEAGVRSLRKLCGEPGVIVMDAPPHWSPEAFTNLNVPDELRAFLESRAARG